MKFQDSVSVCLSKSFDARGRASRPEFWWYYLFSTIFYFATTAISDYVDGPLKFVFMFLWLIFLPAEISAGIRRLHDCGKSGWFSLVPIYSLILLLTEGTPGPNQYGDEPARLLAPSSNLQ